MHTSWSLLSIAEKPALPNSCAYYSVTSALVIQTQGQGCDQHCGKEGGVRGWTEWKDVTVRQKKDFFTIVLMKNEGTPCSGDITLRMGDLHKTVTMMRIFHSAFHD